MAATGNSQKQTGPKTARKTASNGSGGAGKATTKARSGAQRSTAKRSTAKKASAGAKKTSAASSRSSRSSRSPSPKSTRNGSSRGSASSRRSSRTTASSTNGSAPNGSLRSKLVPSALGAMLGGAAVGAARLANRHSQPKVLGVRIPAELNPRHLGRDLDLTEVIRHIGNFAEQLEARSEDVRALSAQAKRLSRRIS